MYIEEIIIDGFKSYAKKTTIGLFDKQFNAITGLNGSGKSNIIDAICFVMGIQNLSTVRVQTLQELIYKSYFSKAKSKKSCTCIQQDVYLPSLCW